MRVLMFVVLALLGIISFGWAEEKPPPGGQPALWLASAADQNGEVVVRISRPGLPPPPVDPGEKPVEGSIWVEFRPVTLGEKVQAFGVDGKPLEAKAVVKALGQPKGVAVFLRSNTADPKTPPEFYRAMFREGTILLVVNAEDIFNPKP